MMSLTSHELERQRDVRYHRTRTLRVRTMRDAARLINAVGFCLLFASTKPLGLPSLFEAVKGRRDAHINDWDQDADLIWGWKNDLPATRRAYYGKALAGKPIFISLAMLPHVIALTAPENMARAYARGHISQESKKVYDALAAMGPTPTMALRIATGLDNARYHHALDDLQRALVILPMGATLEQGAWQSQIFDLVARWFPQPWARAQIIDAETARSAIVKKFVETTIACAPPTISRALGWSRDQVEATIVDLIARRILAKQNNWIVRYGRE